MLKIITTRRDELVETADSQMFITKATTAQFDNSVMPLRDVPPKQSFTEVKLYVKGHFWQRRLNVPPQLENAVAEFMQGYHAQAWLSFDCYAFACLVKQLPPHSKRYLLTYWDLEPLPTFKLPGQVIFLLAGKNYFCHAAIYVGAGLYVSVWGGGGDLEFATLPAMKRDFMADKVKLAKPR